MAAFVQCMHDYHPHISAFLGVMVVVVPVVALIVFANRAR